MKKYLATIYNLFVYSFGQPKLYYKNGNLKSSFQVFADLIYWYWKEKYFNNMYYAMGLNLKENNVKNYFGRKRFYRVKNRAERFMKIKAKCNDLNFDVITKDKFYAASILSANDIPIIPTEILVVNGRFIVNGSEIGFNETLFKEKCSYIIKDTALEAGEGILVCVRNGNNFVINGKECSKDVFLNKLQNKICIIQRKIDSHFDIRKINDSALNTTRIVTIRNGDDIKYLAGFQSFATNGAEIDSWSSGSVYAGIDIENSCLKKYAITSVSDNRPGLLEEHPDSNIVFEGYKIPYLNESVELCIKAHRLFYFNFVIGWDIAITDDGPIIVEANEKPGMNVVQCVDGGLYRKVLTNYKQLIDS
ncbi:MAG TPA: sugar-transfer associated ATP-grasp domain-containing protein [Bacteroidales bacterium]